MYGKTYMGITRSHWVIDEKGVLIDEQIKITPENSIAQAIGAITL